MVTSDIDFVITWVDGADPLHQQRRSQWQENTGLILNANAIDANRWRSHDELYYCLESIAFHAPWVRNIWLVTDQQEPDESRMSSWLKQKVKIVDHAVIFRGFESVLPTYSSVSIESALWRIPKLSEQFVYFNDDTFLTQPTQPTHFFTPDGLPILRGRFMDVEKQKSVKMAHIHKINAAEFVGVSHRRYFNTAHIAAPLNRTIIEDIFNLDPALFERNIEYRFRSDRQLSLVGLHDNYVAKQGAYKRKLIQDWLVFPSDAHESHSPERLNAMAQRMYDSDIRFVCINNLWEIEQLVPEIRAHLARAVGKQRDAYWYYRALRGKVHHLLNPAISMLPKSGGRSHDIEQRGTVVDRDAPTLTGESSSAKSAQAKRHQRDSIFNRYDAVDLLRQDLVERRNGDVVSRIRARAPGQTIRVGFIVNQAAKWNSDSIWQAMRESPLFDVRIYVSLVPFARNMSQPRRIQQYCGELKFYEEIDQEVSQLYDPETDTDIPIEDIEADVVFLQQPWGMKEFPRRLMGKSLCCYMHYGFKLMDNEEMHFNVASFHSYLWAYFEQTELHRRIHLGADPSASSRVVVTGYPKLDAYRDDSSDRIAWPADWAHMKKVIYAPHHSLGEKSLRMSTFRELGRAILQLAKANPDVCWAYKPHPMLHFEVVRRNVMSSAEYRDYIDEWHRLENAIVYDQGSYFGLFKGSSAMITDSGSFLAEYLPTGSPIIWLKNPARIGFNAVGNTLADCFYSVVDEDELLRTFDSVVSRELDPLASARQQRAQWVFSTSNDSAAFRVVDYIRGQLGPP